MTNPSHRQATAILVDFVRDLKLTLGKNLVGVYLYGSLATEDFNEEQSDVDLLMVLEIDVGHTEIELLTSLHKQFNTKHRLWQKRIDVAYVSQEALWTFQEKPYRAIVSDGKGLLETVNAPQYYLIDWYKVQEHGVVLFGPKVAEIMPPITAADFMHTIYGYMLTLPKYAKGAEKRGEQAYVILTTCRSLYANTFAKNVSKKAGADWAMSKYPQWKELIHKALKLNRNEAVDGIVDKANQKATIVFVNFALRKTENKA